MTSNAVGTIYLGSHHVRVSFPDKPVEVALEVLRIEWTAPQAPLEALFETITTWTPLGRPCNAVPLATPLGRVVEVPSGERVEFDPGELIIPAGDRPWAIALRNQGRPIPPGVVEMTIYGNEIPAVEVT